MKRSVLLVSALTSVAVAVALTGCAAAAPSSASSGAPGASTSASAAPPAGSSASLDKLCSLLTLDDVNAPLGDPFATAADSVDPATGDHLCTYTSSDGSTVVKLGLVTPGRTTYARLAAKADPRFDEDEVGDHSSFHGDEFDFQTGKQVFYLVSSGSTDAGIPLLGGMGEAVVTQLGR